MTIRSFAVPAFAVAALFTTAASAHEGPRRPCAADVQKFCSDVEPGGGRIIACLKSHENELSPECQAAGERMKERMQKFQAACGGDVQTFCKDVQPGGGRIIQCLKSHENELSPTCQALGQRMKARRQEFKQACGGDVQNFCKDVQPGGGRIIQCLKSHQNELSQQCASLAERVRHHWQEREQQEQAPQPEPQQ